MTDESIDWVDGKGWYELTDREQALLSKVHDEAYARGFRDGERFGAEEALRASTTLTTAFENRPTQRARKPASMHSPAARRANTTSLTIGSSGAERLTISPSRSVRNVMASPSGSRRSLIAGNSKVS